MNVNPESSVVETAVDEATIHTMPLGRWQSASSRGEGQTPPTISASRAIPHGVSQPGASPTSHQPTDSEFARRSFSGVRYHHLPTRSRRKDHLHGTGASSRSTGLEMDSETDVVTRMVRGCYPPGRPPVSSQRIVTDAIVSHPIVSPPIFRQRIVSRPFFGQRIVSRPFVPRPFVPRPFGPPLRRPPPFAHPPLDPPPLDPPFLGPPPLGPPPLTYDSISSGSSRSSSTKTSTASDTFADESHGTHTSILEDTLEYTSEDEDLAMCYHFPALSATVAPRKEKESTCRYDFGNSCAFGQ